MHFESIRLVLHLPDNPFVKQNILLSLHTLLWIVGGIIFKTLANLFFWDFMIARAIQSPIPGALKALSNILIFLGTVACIIGAVFEQSVTGFLAALGAGGFALGLALRNLFSDIFTGLAINLDRTFVIGDWIELVENNEVIAGQISEIGWRSTNLVTETNKTIVIPNSNLGEMMITNISRPTIPTRYQVCITLDFSVPVARAKRVFFASLLSIRDQKGFVPDKDPEVLLGNVNENGLEYVLRYWILPWNGISPNRAKDVITNSAIEHLKTAGISPTYEKTDIYYKEMPIRNSEGHTLEDQIALLSRIELFSELRNEELAQIAVSMHRHFYNKGDTICRQGEAGDSLFILTEGLLDIFVSSEKNSQKQSVARLFPGEFVGEMALLTGELRSATITALTSSVAYEIKGDAIRGLLENRHELAEILSQIVAERKIRIAASKSQLSHEKRIEEVASFASQVLNRMIGFLKFNSRQVS